MSPAEPRGTDLLTVKIQTHRRTVLVEFQGELDICTTPHVADVLDGLKPEPTTVRHVVLDLRGLTFMDVRGVRELIKQADFARENRHNFAVVRGQENIQRLLKLVAAEELLVLVDEPEDLAPPPPQLPDAIARVPEPPVSSWAT